DETEAVEIKIDMMKPNLTIDYPSDGQRFDAKTVGVKWSADDITNGIELSGLEGIYIALDQANDFLRLNENETNYTFNDLTDGIHKVYLKAKDKAGNFSDLRLTQFSVNSSIPLASVEITGISGITMKSVQAFGIINDDKGVEVISKGVCWSQDLNPTIALSTKTNEGYGNEIFSTKIIELEPGITYHVRAYATNCVGTSYSEDVKFTTNSSALIPSLITNNVSDIVSGSAVSGGYIISDGDALILSRGVCWSTNANPTLSDSFTIDGNGTGAFIGNITGLTSGNTYHVRAYATNSAGTSYGEDKIFTTITENSMTANFSFAPVNECTPLTFSFFDESTGDPTSWAWDVNNDGVVDYTVKNPTHTYNSAGTYSVKLSVTNAAGTNSKTQSNYITANSTLTPNVSINVSPSRIIYSGQLVTFAASPTNSGTNPKYQWKVNGNNVGSNSPTYLSSTLTNGQIVSCEMTSNSPCASPTVATSNSITMAVSATTAASVEIGIKTGSNPTCMGELVTFTASPTNGGTAPSYIWKIGSTVVGNGASYTTNNLSDGQVVTCEITSNDAWVIQNTATSNAITMKVNSSMIPTVTIALTSGSNPSNEGQSLIFTVTSTNGGSSPSYHWKVNGSDVGDSRPTFSSIYIRDGQVISCEMYSSSTCANPTKATSNTITMKVNFPVSSETISVNDLIKVYPNPTTGIITIEGLPENHKTKIAVYTANGKLIMKKTTFANQDKIDISKQVPGTYVLVVNKQTVKVIKE
ncbi:MAG: PKD domain-containing protein, partial [Bacteroidota bacterium]|nr:PKD domain-containing protein [Bacteroidota bacterium]